MSIVNTKTAELIISGAQHTGSALKLFSPAPLYLDPSGRTYLFGIIQSPNTKLFKIIEESIGFMKNEKGEDDQKYIDFGTSQLAVESQLETILQNINSELLKFLSKKEISSTIKNTNIILGLQNEDAIAFAGRGQMHAIIIRAKKNSQEIGEDSYEVMDLLKQPAEEITPDEENELFSYFLSGKLFPNDTLTLSTKNLWEKIVEENLIRGIALLPPSSAVEFIKNNLPQWREGGATALLLKYTPLSQEEQTTPRQNFGRTFKGSIETLLGTEQKTEKILSASMMFKNSLLSFFNILNPHKNDKQLKNYRSPGKSLRQRKGAGIEKNLRKFFGYFVVTLKFIFIFLSKIFHHLFLLITKKNKWEKTKGEIKTDFKDGQNKLFKWFNSLPKRSRIIFVFTIFAIFIFTQSIFIFNIKKNYERKGEEREALAQQIKVAAEAAEASMIYNDDAKAEKLLEDAEILLAGMKKKTKKEKNDAAYLKQLINEKWERLQHVIDINEPRLIADLGNTSGEFLTKSNNSIYILSPINYSVLKMDPDSGRITPHLIFEKKDLALLFWTEKDSQNSVIFEKHNLPDQTEIQIAKGEEINFESKNIKELNCSEITERIRDLKIFNNNLYTLDAGAEQIWKHSLTLFGFEKNKAWLNDESVNLSDGVALALDGSVYVLKSDGTILKLYAGKNTNFNAKIPKIMGIENYLGTPDAKIWTSSEAKYIYILDKTNNRIIAFDKNGKLAAQYISSSFTNLKDFIIQEKEHKIYVLNDTQIYGIIASHVDFQQESE